MANPREVAEILLVPTEHLLDRSCYHAVKATGNRYHIHHFTWGSYVIWVLAAAVQKRFLEVTFDREQLS